MKEGIITVYKLNEAFLKIECNDRGVLKELSEFFTFYVPGYKFTPAFKEKQWDGKIRLFNLHTRQIYYGLLSYIIAFTKDRNYPIEISDKIQSSFNNNNNFDILSFIKNNQIVLSSRGNPINPTDEQVFGINHAIDNERALILSPTASGKSLIIYLIIRWFLKTFHNNDEKFLIIVPTTSLVNQLYSDFGDYSEFDKGFSNEKSCHMIYSGKDKHSADKRVFISTWQSLYNLEPEYFEQFKGVIGDECHLFKAKSLTGIMSNLVNANIRIGTTGTLDSSKTNKLVLEGLFGLTKKITTTKKLIEQGKLSDLEIFLLKLNYDKKICKDLTKAKYAEEIDYIVQYYPRNNFISNLALDQDGNTLILFQFIEKQGKPLYDLIRSKADENRKIFFVTGAVGAEEREEIRRLTEKESNAIICASYGVFSVGINIRNIHRIIFASPSKSPIRVLQSIGRGLRKSDDGRKTILYDLIDDLSDGKKLKQNFGLKHGIERIKIYSKEQFDFKTYDVPLS